MTKLGDRAWRFGGCWLGGNKLSGMISKLIHDALETWVLMPLVKYFFSQENW